MIVRSYLSYYNLELFSWFTFFTLKAAIPSHYDEISALQDIYLLPFEPALLTALRLREKNAPRYIPKKRWI